MYLVALCAGVKQATPFRGMVLLVQVCTYTCIFDSLFICIYVHVYICEFICCTFASTQTLMNVSLVETTAPKPASTQLDLLSVGAWQGTPWMLTTQHAQVSRCIPVSVCVCVTCISLQSNVSLCVHMCVSLCL